MTDLRRARPRAPRNNQVAPHRRGGQEVFAFEPTRAEIGTTLTDFLAYAARKHPLLRNRKWGEVARGEPKAAMAAIAAHAPT